MKKSKKAIIFGNSSFSEIVYFYLTQDSPYDVCAFTVDIPKFAPTHFDLPVLPFHDIETHYPPDTHHMFIAVGYTQMNSIREKYYNLAKEKQYKLLSYISSKATVWSEKIGDNCFILEHNTIQPFVIMGNNCIIWSGNHIGHHSVIDDHCYITSQVVISGHCRIGKNSFIGVNATLRDSLTIGKKNVIGAGALLLKSTKDNEVYIGNRSKPFPKTSDQIEKI